MKLELLTSLFLTLLVNTIFSQTTFEKKIGTQDNEYLFNSFELPNNNFFIAATKKGFSNFITLDNAGNIISQFYDTINPMYGATFPFGNNIINAEVKNDTLYISKLDLNFNLIQQNKVFFLDTVIVYPIFYFVDNDSNIILSGRYSHPNPNPIFPEINEGYVIKFDKQLVEKSRHLNFNADINTYDYSSLSNIIWDNYLDKYVGVLELNGNSQKIFLNDTLGIDTMSSLVYSFGHRTNINYSNQTSKFYVLGAEVKSTLIKDVVIGIYSYTFDTLSFINFGGENPNGQDTNNISAINQSIAITGNGVYVGGTYNYNIYSPATGGGVPSWYFIGKIGNNNQFIWKKRFGGDNFYSLVSITPTSDGGVLVGGFYYDFNSTVFQNDLYIIKLDSNGNTTWTQNISEPEVKLRLFPNPTAHQLNLQLSSPNQYVNSLNIFDLQGKEVLKLESNSAQQKIDISNLPSGVYLIKGKTNLGQDFSRKFVKQ